MTWQSIGQRVRESFRKLRNAPRSLRSYFELTVIVCVAVLPTTS